MSRDRRCWVPVYPGDVVKTALQNTRGAVRPRGPARGVFGLDRPG
jgi:hypothetical protein